MLCLVRLKKMIFTKLRNATIHTESGEKKKVIETHRRADPSTGRCRPLPWQGGRWADGLCWKSVEMHF